MMDFVLESAVSELAHKYGLSHVGYGRFANQHGEITHVSRHGKLVHVSKIKDFSTLHGGQLKHLEHSEDEVFNNGHQGVRNVIDHIQALRHGDPRIKMSVKWDGSPSAVIGRDSNGKHWIATKSAFNKDPKINYTDEDVDNNHGHAPGLAQKLKTALKHIHKLGLKPGQTVQSDILFDDNDKKEENGNQTFKPNTIKYSVDSNSDEGKKINNAKLGLAIHTEYKNGEAQINPDVHTENHPDIYKAPVKVDHEKVKFDNELLKSHESEIGRLTKSMSADQWQHIQHPAVREHVKTYINSKVRAGESNYNVPELLKHIHSKLQKEIDSVKTPASKVTKAAKRDALLKHVMTHSSSYSTAFEIQKHITDAKHHIVDKLNEHQNETFKHSYADGTQTNPEGYVSVGHHGPLKFVNRADFSRANFAQSANR